MKSIVQVYFVLQVILCCVLPTAYSATPITCTVTAKKADSVKIECAPHKTAGPRVGDKVAFKTRIKGLEVNAGQGEVTEVTSRSVGVRVVKGRPRLKMTAVVQATGRPAPVQYVVEIAEVKSQVKNKTYRTPGARLGLILPGGLKFKNYLSSEYNADIPDAAANISIAPVSQGWTTTSVKGVHKRMRDNILNTVSGTNKCKIVWKDREINGKSSMCIASRIQCVDSLSGQPEDKFMFIASCKAVSFPGQTDLIENYYSLSLSNQFFHTQKGINANQAEKIFDDALRSLSIEILE